ncbi:hypothetical protein AB1Y20_007395 [Prymnesium parvum]|uniref:Centrosomal protein of 162 kDa n=1 Tax=Prymnesium parvum TaxID=97485 RepID=A0AB34IYH4_PRYPA
MLASLEEERIHLFGAAEVPPAAVISAECHARVVAHLDRLHDELRTLHSRLAALEAEAAALAALPPPPPIGSEELHARDEALQAARTREETLRRQLGALVHEKGQLHAQLAEREAALLRLAEEKASIVRALGAAVQRVAAEREEARAARGAGADAVAGPTVTSQKRTIEALRREVGALRKGAAGAAAAGEAAAAAAAEGGGGGAAERALRHELEAAREQMAMASLQYRSDRASMATELAVLRSQLSDAEQQRDAFHAQLQAQREAANDLHRQLQQAQHEGGGKADHAAGVALAQVVVHVPKQFPVPAPSFTGRTSFSPWRYLTAPISWLTGGWADQNHPLMAV